MVEIVAAIIGAVLAALAALKVSEHRNLITYDITEIPTTLPITDNKLALIDDVDSARSVSISSYLVKIVNRGWRSANDVKLHAEGDYKVYSINKKASGVSTETINLRRRGNSLEISIDFLPPKEEVVISFSTSQWPMIYKFTGAGTSYHIKQINYFVGYMNALSTLRTLVLMGAAGALMGTVIGLYLENDRLKSANERLYLEARAHEGSSDNSPD